MAKRDAIVFGVRAVQALAQHRPDAILRVLYLDEVKMQLGEVLKATAAHRKPYREVMRDDLDALCSTAHHEGVVAVAKPFELRSLNDIGQQLQSYKRIIALDDVANPHNVGAVARTAAWFGFDAMILKTESRTLNPAAIRVSQGGVFSFQCFRADSLAPILRHLKAQEVEVFGLTQNGGTTLSSIKPAAQVCLVFGNERDGLSEETERACPAKVRIEGSGHVESLNISVAAGIAMEHFTRR